MGSLFIQSPVHLNNGPAFMFDQHNRGKIKNSKIQAWRAELGMFAYEVLISATYYREIASSSQAETYSTSNGIMILPFLLLPWTRNASIVAMDKKRKYFEEYLKFGFTSTAGFPHIFKIYFPYFFNTKLNNFNTII